MILHWPQITLLLIWLFSFSAVVRSEKQHIVLISLIYYSFQAFLLYQGGFFG